MSEKRNILRDNFIFDYKLKQKDSDNPSVLCTLEGYATFSDDDSNANGHYYPGDFWNKVLSDNQEIKEKLDTKTFFGSARHPEPDESPTPEFDNISHNVRDFKVTDKGDVWVTIDVLNTDTGRVIKTLVDYGSKIGISTRAYGEVKEDDNGRLVPVLDNYYFVTWDLVTYPAFGRKATLDKVQDGSVEISEKDLNMSDVKGFMEKVSQIHDNKEVKMICDYAGIQYSNEDFKSEDAKALDEAMNRIIDLENKVQKLRNGNQVSDEKKNKYKHIDFSKKNIKKRNDKASDFSISDEELKRFYAENKLKSDLDETKKQLNDVKNKKYQVEKDKENVEIELNNSKKDIQDVKRNRDNFIESFKNKLSIYSNRVVKLEDEVQSYEKKVEDLNNKLSEYNKVYEENETLSEKLERLEDEKENLESELNSLKDSKKELENKNKQLLDINNKLKKDIESRTQKSDNTSSNDKSIKVKTKQPMIAADKTFEGVNNDKKNKKDDDDDLESLDRTFDSLNKGKK